MPYEIRNYKEEYLDRHVEIGTTVYEKWQGQNQSSVDQLKRAYSGDNFDPETKFYAFKDNEMVGFLTASVQPSQENQPLTARMEFPVVLEGHEEASKELFNRAVETLKGKGVGRLLSRASPHWGETRRLTETYGYQQETVISRVSRFAPGTISLDVDTSNVTEFDFERDVESTLQAFSEFYNITDENQLQNLRTQLETLDQQVATIHAQSTAIVDGRVMGRQLMYSPSGNPDRVILGSVMAIGENAELITKQVLAKNIAIAREKGISEVSFSLFGSLLEREEEFNQLGFQFEEDLTMFRKEL